MFRKREKKTFPPGTFIATPARVAAITHLCFALSLLLWIVSQPFMGDLFAVKSEMVLYESLFDKPHLVESLPAHEINVLTADYIALKDKLQLPLSEKLRSMMQLLFIKTAPLELAWLFFSLVIPLLLLLRIEGTAQACWLLPLIVLAYGIDNQFNTPMRGDSSDHALFPTEYTIIHDYLLAPLSADILQQQRQLKEGWQKYLIVQWAHEKPAEEASTFVAQVEKGEFAFTHARIKARSHDKILAIEQKPYRLSPLILGLYLLWNAFFASIAIRFLISRHLLTSCAAIGAPSLPNPPNRK